MCSLSFPEGVLGEMTYPDDYINRVICGDCLDIMKGMPDKSVDLVVTDPPYNAGRAYKNDNLNEIEYNDFTDRWLSACKRITKDNLVVIVGVKYQKPIITWLFDNMNYCWEFVWWKSNGMLNGKATLAHFDKVIWFAKRTGTYYRTKKVPTDVWNLPIRLKKYDPGHPTPKEVKGMSKIIILLSKETDIILDPFLGSGTTAVACKQLNRRFIGIEINPEYCKIAEKRLKSIPESLFNQ